MNDFITQYWQYIAITVVGLVIFGFDKVKTLIGGIKFPSKTTVVKITDSATAEDNDIDAIKHLRDRAVVVKDKELLLEIKHVSNKFFDLHSIIDDNASK